MAPLLSWSARLFGGSRTEDGEQTSIPQGTMTGSRFYTRHPIHCSVEVFVQTADGNNRSLRTRGVDISELGLLIEAPEPITAGTSVFVNAKSIEVTGSAYVRHCKQRGSKYRVGLEFQNPITRIFAKPRSSSLWSKLWKKSFLKRSF